MNADGFSNTVRQIYAAASDYSLWPRALHAIEELTGSAGAVIDFVPKGTVPPFTLAGGFTAEQCRTFSVEYQHLCRRVRYAMEHPNLPIYYDRLILDEAGMDRDPVYAWLGSHGLRYYVGSFLRDTATHHVVWSLQRTRRQGHAQEQDLNLVQALKPHLSQAIALAEQVGSLQQRWRFSTGLLDALPHAIFLLGPGGELLYANLAGDRLLSEADALQLVAGRLTPIDRHDRDRFEKLLSRRLSHETPQGEGQWLRLTRLSGRLPYALFMAPLELADLSPFSAPPALLVSVHDVTARSALETQELRDLYGLTEAEAHVACALAEGHDVRSASATLGVAEQTTRSHLKHVFRKMNVNRQQDVIRILTSLNHRV